MDMCVRPLQVERDGRVDDEAVRARRLAAQHKARCADVDGPPPGQQVALQLDPAHGLLAGGLRAAQRSEKFQNMPTSVSETTIRPQCSV